MTYGISRQLENTGEVDSNSSIRNSSIRKDYSHLPPAPEALLDGRYRVMRLLGAGALGRVFLAEDMRMDFPVALKEMFPLFISPEGRENALERFKEEANLLYQLKHEFLPVVTGHFIENGRIYLVMQYVEGKSLEEIARKRPGGRISFEESLRWMNSILDILKYLHNFRPVIIHRDIKPVNIILTGRGEIFLVDFGVTYGIGKAHFTRVGHPEFSSLEHYTGKFSPSSDIFSLGAAFHYLLSGDNPGNRDAFIFPPLSKYRDDIPGDFQKILDKMLSLRKEERYQTADLVQKDMDVLLQKIPEEAPVEETQVIAASTSTSLPVSTSIPPFQTRVSFDDWKCLKTLPGHSGDVYSIAFFPAGKYLASGGEDDAIKIWDVKTGECLRTIKTSSGNVRAFSISPGGKLIASGQYDSTVKIWSAGTGDLLRTLEGHEQMIRSVAFSPDGSVIASGGQDRTIRLWNSSTGESINILEGHKDWIYSIAFSPDGCFLASAGDEQLIKLWDSSTGECIREIDSQSRGIYALAFSPAGRYVAGGGRNKAIRIWDADRGDCIRTMEGHADKVRTVAFSPDGKFIASGGDDNHLKVWNSGSGECIRTLEGHSWDVRAVAFSPYGEYIASGSSDGVDQNRKFQFTLKISTTYGRNIFRRKEYGHRRGFDAGPQRRKIPPDSSFLPVEYSHNFNWILSKNSGY